MCEPPSDAWTSVSEEIVDPLQQWVLGEYDSLSLGVCVEKHSTVRSKSLLARPVLISMLIKGSYLLVKIALSKTQPIALKCFS